MELVTVSLLPPFTAKREAAVGGGERLDNIKTTIAVVGGNKFGPVGLEVLGPHQLPVPTWTGRKIIHPEVDVGCSFGSACTKCQQCSSHHTGFACAKQQVSSRSREPSNELVRGDRRSGADRVYRYIP